MKPTTEVFGNVVVVHTPESICDEHAEEIRNYLSTQGASNIILDMDGTESIDSDGLELLLDAYDQVVEQGGELKISTTNLANRKILEITRLDKELDVFSSVIEAVKSFV